MTISEKAKPAWRRLADEDPPLKWLVDRLRGLARDEARDESVLVMKPEDHICWLAADLITEASVTLHDGGRAALQKFVDHYPHGINPYLDEAYSEAREALAK